MKTFLIPNILPDVAARIFSYQLMLQLGFETSTVELH